MALTQDEESALLTLANRVDFTDLVDAMRARADAQPHPDFIVRMLAVVYLRTEGLPEEDTKVYFDDTARIQGLPKRLRDAVEDTDFYIDFDVSDVEVETA